MRSLSGITVTMAIVYVCQHKKATIATSTMLEYTLFHKLDSTAFYKSKTTQEVEFLVHHFIIKCVDKKPVFEGHAHYYLTT